MEIALAETAGFCFGVKRAIEMVHEALQDREPPIYSLGPLIHNPRVVHELEEQGLRVVKDISEIPTGRVVIRSHGVGPGVYKKAAEQGLTVIDATCPFVKNVQQLAILLQNQGYQVLIYGESEHAEVRGVLESVSGNAKVVSSFNDLNPDDLAPKIGIISQTTQDITGFQEIVAKIVPVTKEIRVFNTICLATSKRQEEAAELSNTVDLMIVVGGKNSANTYRLAEIGRKLGTPTVQVESPLEITADMLKGVARVGVTAGASTPEQQIKAVIDRINKLGGRTSD